MLLHIATAPTTPDTRSPEASTIETARLSLTALRPSDLDAFNILFGDASTARMTHAVPHPLRHEAAVDLLEGMGAGRGHRAIRLGDDTMIGVVSLTGTACGKARDVHSFGPHLSVFVTAEHRGHGYAVEAIDGLLGWVRRRRLHRVIHAAHFGDNLASARVLIAADFLYTGRRTMETSLAREGEHQALHMVRLL